MSKPAEEKIDKVLGYVRQYLLGEINIDEFDDAVDSLAVENEEEEYHREVKESIDYYYQGLAT